MAVPEFPTLPEPIADLSAGQSGTLYYATRTPFDLDVILGDLEAATPTTGVGTLFLPDVEGSEPVPAMVLLHGSGGIKPGREMEYGQLLADNGIAAFVVNYYLPRGITDDTSYMARVLAVTEFDAISDAYAALELLSSRPRIDGTRIGVAGYSYGGMATRFALDRRIHEALAPNHPGFALHVDYYGPCFQVPGTRETNGVPLLTLRGTEDLSNDLEACTLREEELRALGTRVEAHVYQGAGHAWEAATPRRLFEDSPYVVGCEVTYDEHGYSSIGNTPIVEVPRGTPRIERIKIRASSGGPMRECVKYGYVIGHDPETKSRSDAHLLDFLERGFTR
jgi:dienelactone hydrolase